MKEFLCGRTGNPLLPELKKYIYAHRGYHDKPVIPENSIPAFRRAIERRWGAELDVHLLKDGSLMVFHDSDLKRCTGTEGVIEELTFSEAKKLHLEGTDETIPSFDEVLELFEKASLPLIIELKAYGKNHAALSKAVCERLDRYTGLFCIESFDPRVICDIRKLRPSVVRGQLSNDFFAESEDEPLPYWQKVILTGLFLNIQSKPDFIAYKFEDREKKSLQRCLRKGIQEVSWTIRNKEDMESCQRNGSIPIFETFDPESK